MIVDIEVYSDILEERICEDLQSRFADITSALDDAIYDKIIPQSQKYLVEVVIISNDEIQELNKTHRHKDKPTDTLSFPLEHLLIDNTINLGSIAISYDYAKDVAHKLGHSDIEEICILFIHSFLHLLGFDHENDDGKHRNIESQIAKKHNLPYSLIDRTLEG